MSGAKIVMETAVDFFEQMVMPDLAEFKSNPTDLRRAFHLASSLFHLRDWVFVNYGHTKGWKKKEDVQRFAEGKCRHFALIAAIANSTKHLKLRDGSPYRATGVFGAPNTFATITFSPCRLDIDPYSYKEGSGSAVVIDVGSGAIVRFEAVAEAVFKMWQSLFRSKGWGAV
jgi:hypothetical protein